MPSQQRVLHPPPQQRVLHPPPPPHRQKHRRMPLVPSSGVTCTNVDSVCPSAAPRGIYDLTPEFPLFGRSDGPSEGPPVPDLDSCLLHQKLQMLQLCIHRLV